MTVAGEPRPRLSSLAVEVATHCNQKCDYCYNAWRGDDPFEPRLDERLLPRVQKLLDAFELESVTLTGGEPLAQKGLFALMDLLSARGVRLRLISNAGLVTDSLARRLAGYPLEYVQVTLNGPERALHDALAGTGHFERTLAGIGSLGAHGVPVVGCCVITKKNAPRLGEILELWLSLGIRRVALSRFSPAGYAARHAAMLLPSRSELLAALGQALPFARERGMRLVSTMPIPPCVVEPAELAPIELGSCPIGTARQEFALGPDGRLKHCTLHAGALGGAHDVLDPEVDPRALLALPEIAAYRREIPEFCRGCRHAESCAGGCGAAAEWVLGHARRFPDPFVWQHVDDELSARFERERRDGKTHLDVVL